MIRSHTKLFPELFIVMPSLDFAKLLKIIESKRFWVNKILGSVPILGPKKSGFKKILASKKFLSKKYMVQKNN